MRDFDYYRPHSLGEAIAVLQERGTQAFPLAGGTDLIIQLKRRRLNASCLVDLKAIPDLYGVQGDERSLHIGALTTHAEVITSPVIQARLPVLRRAARAMGFPEIRNRGTVGGNICNADRSADLVPPLVALGARVRLVGPEGEREVPLEAFIAGFRQTLLRPGEILVAVVVPVRSPHTACVYARYSTRRAGGVAVASAAVLVAARDGRCSDARVVIGAIEPTPRLIAADASGLVGKTLEPEVVRDAASRSVAGLSPSPDPMLPAPYRLAMAELMVKQALEEAWTEVVNGCAAPSA